MYGRAGNDTIVGGDGDDLISGDAGADQLEGGAGLDILNYMTALGGVAVSLLAGKGTRGDASGDTLNGFEDLRGSNFGDGLTGDEAKNFIYGEKGADTIRGLGGGDDLYGADGDDQLFGGEGDDTLVGGRGADKMSGGGGTDTVDYSSAKGRVVLSLVTGGSGGEAKGDTFSSVENVLGSAFDDKITGNSAGNFLSGFLGNDILLGGAGNDTLSGDVGNDKLVGGAGADVLYGDDGRDILKGGTGEDTFRYEVSFESGPLPAERDVNLDFEQGLDRIDFSDFSSNFAAMSFIGNTAFSMKAGELRFFAAAGDTVNAFDDDGDGSADMEIKLIGSYTLTANDFMF